MKTTGLNKSGGFHFHDIIHYLLFCTDNRNIPQSVAVLPEMTEHL